MLITRRRVTAAVMAALAVEPIRSHAKVVALNARLRQHTEDFDTLLNLGAIRLLAPYSRTFFFDDRGSFHGVSAEIADELEKYVRRTYPKSREKFVVVVIPTSRDRLLPDLLDGWGDVALYGTDGLGG
jgi:hypothetical protein